MLFTMIRLSETAMAPSVLSSTAFIGETSGEISGGPRNEVRGAKNFVWADGVKWSHANKVSFDWLGSRALKWVLKALGFFFAEYASLFSRYLFMIFLKQLNTNLS